MASYIEIRNLFKNSDLGNKIDVAVMIAANVLLDGTPTTSEITWAASVFANPSKEGQKALMAVLAANKDATVAQIKGATDSSIQATVDSIVPSLVSAGNL